MAITKNKRYYEMLKQDLEIIKKERNLINNSQAFCYWYLTNKFNLNSEEALESIIDGGDDQGIDAVIYDNEKKHLKLFQFKFCDKVKNITDEIKQRDLLVTFEGLKVLIGLNSFPKKCKNKRFADFFKMLDKEEIDSVTIYFVSFNSGIVKNKKLVEDKKMEFKRETQCELEVIIESVNEIINLYDRKNRNTTIDIELELFNKSEGASSKDAKTTSYIGYINAKKFCESFINIKSNLFDENIRLYEGDTDVNNEIKITSESDMSDKFYFYNNGITFICESAKPIVNKSVLSLHSASIVNGCQTVESLFKAYEEKKLKNDVFVLIRIIIEVDYDERNRITRFLNTQNKIKPSYFYSNDTIIFKLQKELIKHNIFLERQHNESKYKDEFNGVKLSDKKIIILKVEDMVQVYVGYYIDDMANLAKNAKSKLFRNDIKDTILKRIKVKEIIHSQNIYKEILLFVNLYRRFVKNQSNELLSYLGVTKTVFNKNEDYYRFINTGDILLLNLYKYVAKKNSCEDARENIKSLVLEIVTYLKKIKNNESYALLTRSKEFFETMRETIE